MALASDTSREAQEIQYHCWSLMTPEERFERMASFSKSLIETSRQLIDKQWPSLTEEQRYHKYLLAQYGESLATQVTDYLRQTR